MLLLWSALLLAVLVMVEVWYPHYARWRGIPWTWAAIISWGVPSAPQNPRYGKVQEKKKSYVPPGSNSPF
ncbi:hypothetical protein [uncultured Methanofollis sp.]|uniref:hypothetical protein n=1 Tax=uncultured Methanofollis sp. TaxID=262500 RepID=UPI00262BBA2B|nr:hypothetical protein [uncultured Methanofollis sp.]